MQFSGTVQWDLHDAGDNRSRFAVCDLLHNARLGRSVRDIADPVRNRQFVYKSIFKREISANGHQPYSQHICMHENMVSCYHSAVITCHTTTENEK